MLVARARRDGASAYRGLHPRFLQSALTLSLITPAFLVGVGASAGR